MYPATYTIAKMKTVLILLLIIIIIFFAYKSPVKIFEEEVRQLSSAAPSGDAFITEEKIADLPVPVQHYLHYCGFVGQPISEVTEIIWSESKIKLGIGKSWTNLDTRQYNFVSPAARLAYMKTSLAWLIPFEGRDKYHLAQGHMWGILARTINVFNNKSREVTDGGAVIFLAESLIEPSIALQKYISWEPVDKLTAKAVFHDGEVKVSGLFHFNEVGEYIRFESFDRPYEVSSGVYELKPFRIDLDEYQESEGLKIAGHVTATWHLEDGDFTYWDGRISGVNRMQTGVDAW